MNLNFTPEKPNLFIRDSIKSNKQFNLTDNKSKSYKKEDDPFFSINSSKTSQEIKNKYNEISEIKSKTTNNNEKFNELLINKKYSMSSLKSINETSQKRNEKIYNSSNKNNSIHEQDNNNSDIDNNNFVNINNYPKKDNKKTQEYPEKLITNYKLWTGNNYFPLKAKIIEGPTCFKPTLTTITTVTIPIILFYIFESEYYCDELTVFIPIVFAILYIIILLFILIASFSDPGIIRKFVLINDINKEKNKIDRNERIISRIFHLGHIISYKYCNTCGIIRPNRSTHCRECNNCVERLDHHCPWIGNCAGKRNYIYFFIFLTILNILQIFTIIFCLIRIIKQAKDYSKLNNNFPKNEQRDHIIAFSFCESIMSLYLIIYSILFMLFSTPLIRYHIKLILTNTTTKEKLRNAFYRGNPFSRSKWKNLKNVLFPLTKKYSILDILRGDYREICDDKKPNNKKRQKSKLNEKDKNSQYFEETNLGINTNIMELKNDKIEFDKYNDIIINNSEPKSETIQIKNEKDSFRRNNTDKNETSFTATNENNNKNPEPLDTVVEQSDNRNNDFPRDTEIREF